MFIPSENTYQLLALYDRALNHRADLKQLKLKKLSSESNIGSLKISLYDISKCILSI
jgi:hypothetical protein